MAKKIEIRKKWTEGEIVNLLRQKYDGNQYAFLTQVRNCTGYGEQIRTADAIVMNLWPSHGLSLTCFEIKTSRSDFLNEIKKPSKHVSIAQYCDYFYIVTPVSTVSIDDLPKEWGLMEVRGAGALATVKKAEKYVNVRPLDRTLLASLCRNIAGGSNESALAKELTEKISRADCQLKNQEESVEKLKNEVAELKKEKMHVQTEIGEIERQFQIKFGVDIRKCEYGWRMDSARQQEKFERVLSLIHLLAEDELHHRIDSLHSLAQRITEDIKPFKTWLDEFRTEAKRNAKMINGETKNQEE